MSTDKSSPNKIVMFSIFFSISVLMLEVCTPSLPRFYAVLIRLFTLFWYIVAASLLEVDESALATGPMSKSEAAAVTEEIVHASDESKDAVSETTYDEFHEFNDQQYFDNCFVQRFVFKIRYGYTLKRFVAPIVNESFVFDMSDLKERIIYLFDLPIDSELELSYIDEDWELITMTDDNDLEDIMTQMTLPILRMYVKVIHNAPYVQVGGAGLRHTCTSKSTSSSESGFCSTASSSDHCSPPPKKQSLSAKSDNDDWLLF